MSTKRTEDRYGDLAKFISKLKRDIEVFTRSCINCEHFNEEKELCSMFNARPPARIIALGCEHHIDEIPF